jgi:hypothetical protein
MSTLVAKPIKKRILNPKLLPIAALVLVVLAMLFMASPLMPSTGGFPAGGNFNPPANGQSLPQNGFPSQGGGPQGQGFPGQGGPNSQGQPLGGRGDGLPGFGLMGGITGTIVYAIALLVSLAAAVGMFLTRRWGQVLGIVMAVIYLLLALVSFIPVLLMSFIRGLNGLSLGLSILHLVLAIAVIVLASIPAKKAIVPVPAEPAAPPAATT